MRQVTAAVAAFVGVLCFVGSALGAQQHVAVLQPDEELLRAISLALSPWGIETRSSDQQPPTPSQPEAVRGAASLAHQLDVEALVWVTTYERGCLLWVFDAGTGDITTRMLPESPPFDGAGAAAVALSVKTVLRTSAIAPPQERYGSSQQATPSPPAAPPKTERVQLYAPLPDQNYIAAMEVGAGGYLLSRGQLDFRGEVAGLLWLPTLDRLGFRLDISSGPGTGITEAAYTGRYREVVVGGKVRWRLVNAGALTAVVGLGGAAHWAVLDGTLTADSGESSASRLNGSVDLETGANFSLSQRIYLGVAARAAYFPKYRRYHVNKEPVFSPWPVQSNLAVYFGVVLF